MSVAVDEAERDADEVPGDPSAADGVDVAADRAVVVGEEHDHRGHLRRVERSDRLAKISSVIRVRAMGAIAFALMP